MTERPYSRYTRAKTWAALYSQHMNAGYAWVPFSRTNNSIAVISCATPEDVQKLMRELEQHADACKAYYESRQTPDKAPPFLEKAWCWPGAATTTTITWKTMSASSW